MFTRWRVKQLARESEWLAVVPEVESASIRPEGGQALSERRSLAVPRLSPTERTQSKQLRNIGRTMNATCTATLCRPLNRSVRAPTRKRADPLGEWIGPNRPRTRYEPRVPPETDAKSTRVFDPYAARVLTRSLSRKFGASPRYQELSCQLHEIANFQTLTIRGLREINATPLAAASHSRCPSI